MKVKKFSKLIDQLTQDRRKISSTKREDYTKGSEDVLANFKNVAESAGVDPLVVWLVYAQKHFDAIASYVRTGGQSESEPIKERVSDLLNYLELFYGLINECVITTSSGSSSYFDIDPQHQSDNWRIGSTGEFKEEDLYNHDIKWTNEACDEGVVSCSYPNCSCSTGRSTGI